MEILGAVTITMAAASIAIISAKDSLLGGQRSAVQRELQSLNTALNNYKAAGGTMLAGSDAEDAIRALKKGVPLEDASYAPLAGDPDRIKRIGEKDYQLVYDDGKGFAYVPEEEGAEFSNAGIEQDNTKDEADQYPFDVSNKEESEAALAELLRTDPNDPKYGSLLEALNAAFALGTLTEEDMLQAGLADYNGSWLPSNVAQLNYAQDAAQALVSGGTWESLGKNLQRAYANVYPQAAVAAGGGEALNMMDPGLLTRELVKGYAQIGGGWVSPSATTSQSGTSVTISDYRTIGPGETYPSISSALVTQNYNIYVVKDPLQPALFVGTAAIQQVPITGSFTAPVPVATITTTAGHSVRLQTVGQTGDRWKWGSLSAIYSTDLDEEVVLSTVVPDQSNQ